MYILLEAAYDGFGIWLFRSIRSSENCQNLYLSRQCTSMVLDMSLHLVQTVFFRLFAHKPKVFRWNLHIDAPLDLNIIFLFNVVLGL